MSPSDYITVGNALIVAGTVLFVIVIVCGILIYKMRKDNH